jgi:hypothetical protein
MSRTVVVLALATALANISTFAACAKQSGETSATETAPGATVGGTTGAPTGVPEIRLSHDSRGGAPGGAIEGAVPTGDGGAAKGADTSFKVAVAAPAGATAGAESVAKISVTPGPGWKMNLEYPTKLKVTAPEGVATPKAVLEVADVAKLDEGELAFDVKLTAAKAGTYKVDGEIKFAVCTPDTCDPKKQTVAFELVAK